MLFNSQAFIFLVLPALLVFYAFIPRVFGRYSAATGKAVLLVTSVIFFSLVAAQYLPIIAMAVLANYLIALAMSYSGAPKKPLLVVGVVSDVLFLVYYKYLDFFSEQITALMNISFASAGIVQPLGISFLTFSLISYLVDVYRGTISADWNFLNVSLWALFFPKITSGPIARYTEMFSEELQFNGRLKFEDLFYGVRRFIVGLAKKTIIADTFGVMVDSIFVAQAATGIDAPTAWLGIILYAFQIFFDFAGYSDMAIGLAAMFGFRLKENFDYPYISKTPGEFWHRWHISLSTWLRDYLYFPLGGSRRGNVYVNLLIVFLLSGLWHGASWHYVAWGAWWGVFMIVDRVYRQHADRLHVPATLTWMLTMLVVLFGWVFFRAPWLSNAVQYCASMLGLAGASNQAIAFCYYLNPRTILLLGIAAVCSTPLVKRFSDRFEGEIWYEVLRSIGLPVLFVVSVLFMVNCTYSPFLYAQF